MAARLDGFRSDREIGAHMGLLRVLQHVRAYTCHDPRDKVFASLGMAADVGDADLLPNYGKHVSEVYDDVTRFVFSSTTRSSLDFLGYVLRHAEGSQIVQHQTQKLPSWVPDWEQRISFGTFEKSLNTDAYSSARALNASGDQPQASATDGPHLSVRGVVLDTISEVGLVCDSSLAEAGFRIEESWRPSNVEQVYQFTGESLDQAFNRTVMADIGRANLRSDSELSRGFAMDWSLVSGDASTMSSEQRMRRVWMLVDMKLSSFGRRFFRTTSGLMGLAPAAAEIDDIVCSLFGGQVLHVLRPIVGEHYEFMGECYVHGMMDGEAVEGCDVGDGPRSEVFVMV